MNVQKEEHLFTPPTCFLCLGWFECDTQTHTGAGRTHLQGTESKTAAESQQERQGLGFQRKGLKSRGQDDRTARGCAVWRGLFILPGAWPQVCGILEFPKALIKAHECTCLEYFSVPCDPRSDPPFESILYFI